MVFDAILLFWVTLLTVAWIGTGRLRVDTIVAGWHAITRVVPRIYQLVTKRGRNHDG